MVSLTVKYPLFFYAFPIQGLSFLRCHLGIGLRFLHRLLLRLGEGGVHTGNDLLAPLDHQSQMVARLPHQLLRLLVVQLEHVAAADLDQVVAGLGSRVGRDAVKRNLGKFSVKYKNMIFILSFAYKYIFIAL